MPTSITDQQRVIKDPDAERVFRWDWDAALAEGASIVTSTWHISPPGALVADAGTDSIASDGRSTSVRLSGGVDRQNYVVTNRIVTDTSPPRDRGRQHHRPGKAAVGRILGSMLRVFADVVARFADVVAGFGGLIADIRRTAGGPAPPSIEPLDVHLRFLAVSLLSAALTWRFAALLAVVVALAWWVDR